HSMKSAFTNIGYNDLSTYAAAMEMAGRKIDIQTVKAFVPRFVEILRELMSELSPDDDTSPDVIDGDLPFLRTSLYTIAQACEQYDIDTAKDTLDRLNQKQLSKKYKKLIKEIATNLLYGDFDEVATLATQSADEL
ncbi:MAG: hypothetical protein FWB78_12195, partial [Treponema sp.]|nr:hypothetical protein [Treponema sp.]